MYYSRIEALRKLIPAEEAVQCVSTGGDPFVPIGTPIIVRIKPFIAVNDKNKVLKFYKNKAPLVSNKKCVSQEKITAKDIISMDSREASAILIANSSSLRALCAINLYGPMHYTTYNISPSYISILRTKPLIHDEGLVIESDDVTSTLEDNNLFKAKTAKELLSNHRFVDVVVKNVYKKRAPDAVGAINKLMGSFNSFYEHSRIICFGDLKEVRVVIDTIVISLYNLSDVIPIFDTKRADGLLLEIHLLSSACTDYDITRAGRLGLIVRGLYSSHKDGVFSIDGEAMRYQAALKKNLMEELVCSVLMDCTPNELHMEKVEEGN